MSAAAAIKVGDYVQAGSTAASYDRGEVIAVRGDEARVRWEAGTSWEPVSRLAPANRYAQWPYDRSDDEESRG